MVKTWLEDRVLAVAVASEVEMFDPGSPADRVPLSPMRIRTPHSPWKKSLTINTRFDGFLTD